MGAYSSWALLALTHHFIVQVAAWESGVIPHHWWFYDYAVLGDDIVIANPKVAKRYIEIIHLLGVECGLHKSLLSPQGTALEFAKRTWYKGHDVSPISVKELVSALYSFPNLIAFGHKYQLSIATLLKVAGFGYKVLGGLNKPLSSLNFIVRNVILMYSLPAMSETGFFLHAKSLTLLNS